MDNERILAPKELSEDNIQKSLRPKTFNEYIGPVSYTHLTLPTKLEV